MVAIWVLVGVAVIAIFLINSLIMKRNNVENAFSGVDVQLKKRYDLIPNLVAAVQKYMEHEKGVLTEITELRKQSMQAGLTPADKVRLDSKVSGLMRNIMVQVEQYPDLKASANMEQLQRSLNEVEEQLSAARRFYNSAVTDFNNAIQMFPGVLFAGILNMHKAELFVIDEKERRNVSVKELFKA